MDPEWLIQRCDSLVARDVRLYEMKELGLSEESKLELLANSEQFNRWRVEKWEPFVANLSEGDEVWRFRSPPETWEQFCGCAGYAVVRNGEIIRSLATLRS